ncbi:unnamed protein product [Closterium sp. NIES-53]
MDSSGDQSWKSAGNNPIQRRSSGSSSSPSSDPLRRPSRQNSYRDERRRFGDQPFPTYNRFSSSSSSSLSGGQNRGQPQQRRRPGMSFQSNSFRSHGGDPVEAHLAHAVSELAATRSPPAEELLGFSEQDIQDANQSDGQTKTRRALVGGTNPPAARMMSRRAILVVTVFLFLLIVLPALLPRISPPPSALLVIPVMLMFMLVYLALAPHHLPGRNHVYT